MNTRVRVINEYYPAKLEDEINRIIYQEQQCGYVVRDIKFTINTDCAAALLIFDSKHARKEV